MEKLNELETLAEAVVKNTRCRSYPIEQFLDAATAENILAIAEAFRAMEQRAEAAEAKLTELEAKLAELEKQKPIGRVDRGAATDSNEYPDARVVCLHEHVGWEAFQDGCELFTRPAPAADLAELVPEKASMADYYENVRSGETDPEEAGIVMWDACRAEMLRNIEEASKK